MANANMMQGSTEELNKNLALGKIIGFRLLSYTDFFNTWDNVHDSHLPCKVHNCVP